MKLDESLVAFRPMLPNDVPFIRDSWSKSFRDSPWAGCVPNNLWSDTLNECVEQLLARGATIEVICAAHDPDKILAWCCSEPIKGGVCTHYVYTKDPYRRKGLATALVERSRGQAKSHFFSFRTRASQYLQLGQHAPEVARRR